MWFKIARFYSKLYGFFHDKLHINLRGLGVLLRRIKTDHVLDVHGRKLFFNHRVSACYSRLIGGEYNEAETHLFLSRVLNTYKGDICFIDVGANVGEMVVSIAEYSNVKSIHAFEPIAQCADTIEESLKLNSIKKARVVRKAVNDDGAPVAFDFKEEAPFTSGITTTYNNALTVEATILDKEFESRLGPTIILIDVEGAEPLVLCGAKQLIKREQPLIVFEYNRASREHFNLEDIKNILGEQYDIYRLRQDGYLDKDFRKTWNCVAVSKSTAFYEICHTLVFLD